MYFNFHIQVVILLFCPPPVYNHTVTFISTQISKEIGTYMWSSIVESVCTIIWVKFVIYRNFFFDPMTLALTTLDNLFPE